MPERSLARRSFLTVLSGLTAGAAALGLGSMRAQAQTSPGPWRPTRHAEDDWYDELPGQHRFFLDTLSVTGLGEGIVFASNYFTANQNGYGLNDEDLAVVVCVRHLSTPFAFNEDMWAKYGESITGMQQLTDPRTGQAPTANVYRASDYGPAFPNRGITLDDLVARGVHFAVCGMASRAFAGVIARSVGAAPDAIYDEIAANLIPNAHMVAAGILAVDRAQARGYSFAYVG